MRSSIRPNDDQPYLMREFEVLPERTGLRPVTIDVELHRGVWVRGRVTNKVTVQPVVGAVVQYLPALTNSFTLHLPEFDGSKRRQHMEGDQRRCYETDAQGNFKTGRFAGPGPDRRSHSPAELPERDRRRRRFMFRSRMAHTKPTAAPPISVHVATMRLRKSIRRATPGWCGAISLSYR